ncbi:hypothetical protein U879_09050 [Defluviimonas sp. 20V17]|uniref:histidine kinase n=1 Tax=Allgaiera indica TaxID=765699 RepID=A0AAN4ZY11_9RHOB|nr:PAS domain S-box protein [Allgaiera indica]KDB03985.1 hypothetical protein U879_09050 [Defluviimonas sp. 20V17]GHD99389.1 hypothetical protein GCM10008024_06570 [Allgaiera indica]SDW27223.1 PAS domain S-box-containing protein [Allgaiera indica]
MFSLRVTIPAITGAVAIAAAGIIAVLFHLQAREIAQAGAQATVRSQSIWLAQQYEFQFQQFARDAALLGNTASVRELVGLPPVPAAPPFANNHRLAAKNAGGSKPRSDNSANVTALAPAGQPPDANPAQAKQAATTLFKTLLETNHEYLQARVISIRTGREILRVDKQSDGSVSPVPEAGLQDKSNESYYRLIARQDWSASTRTGTLRPPALFSRVDFNREFGKISYPVVFTQRVMYPLLDAGRQPAAFVILNFDYSDLLSHVFDELPKASRIVVSNEQGDYLTVDGHDGKQNLQINGEYTQEPSALVKSVLTAKPARGLLTFSDAIGYYTTVKLSPDQPGQVIRVAFVESLPDLMNALGNPTWEGWVAAGLILALALIATVTLTSIVMRPMRALGRAIDTATEDNSHLRMPQDWHHELGRLARAFQKLFDRRVQAETRLNLILDSIGEGIVTIDGSGTIVSFNPACERMFGYDREQALGENVSMLMPLRQARSHDKYLRRYVESGERKIEWEGRAEVGRRSDGSRFPLELTVTETEIDGVQHFIGVLRDISERQKLEQAKSEFLATVSHELRTPLTSIHGILKLLANESIRNDPEKCERFVGIAATNSERLRRLIVNMTEMMEFEGKIHSIARAPLDLLDLVETTAAYRQELEARSGVRIVVAEDCESVRVLGDRERLELVLENLLSNAVKFSPDGGEVRLGIRRTKDGQLGMVTVADEGAGVPEENRKKIWDRFTQADSSSRRSAEGAGLGLAVAAFLMRLHDGSVNYAPREGKGSLFWFELPVLPETPPAPEDADAAR